MRAIWRVVGPFGGDFVSGAEAARFEGVAEGDVITGPGFASSSLARPVAEEIAGCRAQLAFYAAAGFEDMAAG